MATLPSDTERLGETAFEPYARAIGFLLREWNDLQDALQDLFVTVCKEADTRKVLAIWHAVPNDRLQRLMLKAAAKAEFTDSDSDAANKIVEEINWLLDHCDGLGRQRDDAAHVPLALVIDEPARFIPHSFWGNPLALKLQGKQILVEFDYYQQCAEVLRRYARAWTQYLASSQSTPLPKRPTLPSQPQRSGNGRR